MGGRGMTALAVLLLLAAVAAPAAAQGPAVWSAFAAAFNQDILIHADLFSHRPQMLSGGLGFTNIVGVSDNTNETVVRAAGGAWNSRLTCSDGSTPPLRVTTSATPATVWSQGFNCSADYYSGLPVCFSWPVLPSSISKESFLITLSDGTKLSPPCVGISPNWEFNERHCLVLFGPFGNRVPSYRGGLFPTKVEVVRGASLKLVGPRGPVSAARLKFTSSKSPYDPGTNGPVFMSAKLSLLTGWGEGISVPAIAPQTAFPNGGLNLYGAYNGALGRAGARYRLRLFYSGGMTPDGVRSMQPTSFADHFYLLAAGHRGRKVRITDTGVTYNLGGRLGSIRVLGLADTGVAQASYDDCYQEDYDNYIDIIIDASSKHAARALLALRAYYTKEGYSSVYNPGGPGMDPTPGVPYSTPAPPQTISILHALEDPMVVTWCNVNGTFTRNARACSTLVGAPLPKN